MSKNDLDNYDYDNYLASQKKHRELVTRKNERRNLSKDYRGWHFGIDDKPVFCRDKEDFKRQLSSRGLIMRDDVKKRLK